jgi:dTDP-4-amino-4,6-dideoxygalactose transaminase
MFGTVLAVGRIYLSPPDVGDAERAALLRAFDSNWITTMGAEVDAFEVEIAEFTGADAAVALSSGTAALHLALLLHDIGPGDEVWVSTFTFVAPANAVRYVGADLRFIDSERDTWNMDPDLLEQALEDAAAAGRLPRAVIAVDLYGQCAQLDRISAACERFDVVLIEDAAEALGATWQGRHAGTWGRLGVFSFNGNKIMTTSGGGMLVGDRDLVDRARYLAQQARQPVLHYEHTDVGYNYRLSNLLAGMGRAQLERLPAMTKRRRQIHDAYVDALAVLDGVEFMPFDDRGEPNAWLTVMTVPSESSLTPQALCAELDRHDIEARPAWKPMHLQPVFDGVPCVGGAVADDLFTRGVCLPSGSGMTDDDVQRVIDAVDKAVRGGGA